ncbi:MAG: MoaD/ThiS family protein [Thermodesulfobacteriota bacterium]
MKVKVHFNGILADWFGTREAFLELPEGASLGELIAQLRDRFGPRTPEQLWDANGSGLARQVLVTKGGISLHDTGSPLEEDSEVHLFLLLAGG